MRRVGRSGEATLDWPVAPDRLRTEGPYVDPTWALRREAADELDRLTIVDFLFARDAVLSRHRQLTRALVFYMYWNCDIGEGDDAAAN